MNTRNWFWNALFLLYVGVEVTIGSNLGSYWNVFDPLLDHH
jgi:fucose permease